MHDFKISKLLLIVVRIYVLLVVIFIVTGIKAAPNVLHKGSSSLMMGPDSPPAKMVGIISHWTTLSSGTS